MAERKLTMQDLSADAGMRSLRDHAVAKALEVRAVYGPELDYATMLRALDDRRFVRYPVHVVFDAEPLQEDEFAFMHQLDADPKEGFVFYLHPHFRGRDADLPLLMAYHLVVVNYGEIAGIEEAERFGAALCGLPVEAYYERVCALADEVASGGDCAGATS